MLRLIDYRAGERAALAVKPNRIIEAFMPTHFAAVGYPIRVEAESSLHRYIDVMHELACDFAYVDIVPGVTRREADSCFRIARAAMQIAEEYGGRPIVPKNSLIWALNAYRHIRWLSPDPATTIFEVGPGSGYLGALLAASGYRYVAMDVTEPFYLLQNHLWCALYGDRVIELVSDGREFEQFEELPPGCILHVPWWKFANPAGDKIRLSVDVVVAVDTLTEMHRYAFRYLARLAQRWLKQSRRFSYLYVQGAGSLGISTAGAIEQTLDSLSFKQVHADERNFIFVNRKLSASDAPATGGALGFSAIERRVSLVRRLFDSVGALVATAPDAAGVHIDDYPGVAAPSSDVTLDDIRNAVVQAIAAGRRSDMERQTMSLGELDGAMRSLVDKDEFYTADEKFWRFCNGTELDP